jgi:hypothetical protein
MSPTCLTPEPEIMAEPEPVYLREPAPQPPGRKQRVRELLITIFKGHEEYLGLTPD